LSLFWRSCRKVVACLNASVFQTKKPALTTDRKIGQHWFKFFQQRYSNVTNEPEESEGRESLQGWVKMHRRYANEPVFQDENLWRLFSWLLLYARHTPGAVGMKSGRGGKRLVRLQPGQLVTGRKTLAQALNWAESNVKNRLAKLQELGVISIDVDSQFSIVTVTNFQQDQFVQPVEKDSQRPAKGQSKDSQRPTKGQSKDSQRTQRKNGKNDFNEKNETREGESCDFVGSHSLGENPTSVKDVNAELQRLFDCKPSSEVVEKAKAIQRDIELFEPSMMHFRGQKITDQRRRAQEVQKAVYYADSLEKKYDCKCSPFQIETEEQYEDAYKAQANLRKELESISAEFNNIQKQHKLSLGILPLEQLPTIANTFFNYWTGQNWKRKGKPVNWKLELDTWLWREVEKIQKTKGKQSSEWDTVKQY
jgi:hypothetical protein